MLRIEHACKCQPGAEMRLRLNLQAIQAVNEKLKSNVFRRVLGSEVVTELKPAGNYWLAEQYHQQVLVLHPTLPWVFLLFVSLDWCRF